MENLNVHQEKVGFVNDSTSAPGVLHSYSNQEDFLQIMGRSLVVCLFVFKQIQKCSFFKKGKNIYTSVSAHMAPAAHMEKDQVTRREGKSETCTLGLYLSFKFCVT